MDDVRGPTRILVVDDDPNIRFGVRTALEAEGYAVADAEDGAGALARVGDTDPDAVVLDVGMPGLDGLAVCRTLRAQGDRVPILVLTAHDSPRDRVAGLDAGADDYLGKPFDLDELLARLRALVRRAAPVPVTIRRAGPFEFDAAERLLRHGAASVSLTRIEAAIVARLLDDPRRARSRDELMQAIWGEDGGPRSNALEVYVSQLRRKARTLGDETLIATVRGLGYRLLS
jgi:two-component system response regulator MprA